MTLSYENKISPTTIVTVVNLALVVFGGGVAYSRLQADVAQLRESDIRMERAQEAIRAEAAEKDTRLRVVEQGAGRMETKLESISAGIDRITAQLDRLIGPPAAP
jgi:hypothetical protein